MQADAAAGATIIMPLADSAKAASSNESKANVSAASTNASAAPKKNDAAQASTDAKIQAKVEKQQAQMMHGYVSTTKNQDEIAGCIDEALATAIHNSIVAQEHEKAVQHHSRALARTWRGTKAAVNFMLCDRGFTPSMEGGQLELGEKLKVRDKVSAECAKQLWLDKTHDAVVANIIEMVTGLGCADPTRKQQLIDDSMKSLKALGGDACANHIYDRLTNWVDKETAQDVAQIFDNHQPLSIKERQTKVDMIVNATSKDDPIVGDVVKKVQKYTKHNKATVVTSQVVETSLSIASITPNFVAPAASAALLLFFITTGGPEEDKLLSEMYLGKRLESRKNSLNNQAGMAVDANQLAMATHNAALFKCSELLVKRLAGSNVCATVCNDPSMATPAADAAASAQADAAAAPSAQASASAQLPAVIH